MLPLSLQLPGAIALILGSTVSCFFGYRLFRIVLAIGGFILGAFLASSLFGASDQTTLIVAAVIGGVLGAGMLFAAYFVGVALSGAALGVAAAHLISKATTSDPGFLLIVGCAVAGAVASMYLQRYFIIVFTAFGGAVGLVQGVTASLANRGTAAVGPNDVWIPDLLHPGSGQGWVPYAWIVLGVIGAAVQMGWTGGEKGRVARRRRTRKKTVET